MDWTKIASIDDIIKLAASYPQDPQAMKDYETQLLRKKKFLESMQGQDAVNDANILQNQQRTFQMDKENDARVLNSQQQILDQDSFKDEQVEDNRINQMGLNNDAEERWRAQKAEDYGSSQNYDAVQQEMKRLSDKGIFASIKTINDFYKFIAGESVQ